MSTFRDETIRARVASAKTANRRREIVDELTDELVSLRITEGPAPEDLEVLRTLISLIREGPQSEDAKVATEVLSLGGHRRGADRSALIDDALVEGLSSALDSGAASRDVDGLVSALADLSATRPIPAAITPTRELLVRSRHETRPDEATFDSALAVLRRNIGKDWVATLRSWLPDLRDDEPLGEAVRLAIANQPT
jgi:hypothetical protein